jgi:hypothetical protein
MLPKKCEKQTIKSCACVPLSPGRALEYCTMGMGDVPHYGKDNNDFGALESKQHDEQFIQYSPTEICQSIHSRYETIRDPSFCF